MIGLVRPIFRSRRAIWTLIAAAVGFTSSAIFSSLLRLERAPFVLAHGLVTAGFVAVYLRQSGVDPGSLLRRRRLSGVVGGLVLGLVLIRGVSVQGGSAVPTGSALLGALAWYGLVYGVVDAVLLSVVPVVSLYGSRSGELPPGSSSRLPQAGLALAGSLFVTALYHLGFAEFRGPMLIQPLIGNAIVTAGYLLTGSPLAAIISHVIMHGAAVVHGMETTVQLPPHY